MNKKTPELNVLVSIIVPVYKVEEYLERCLDSLIAQDYRPLEIIAVNDGSPDNCGDMLDSYAARYPFITHHRQENKGLGAARNVGIRLAKGEFIALVDSDDYVEHNYISAMMEAMNREQADLTISSFFFEFQSGVKVPYPLLTRQDRLSGLEAAEKSLDLLSIPSFAWNKLYRRSLLTENGIGFPSIYYEDVATTTRVLSFCSGVAITRKPLYHYCLRGTGITGNFKERNVHDYLKAIEIIRYFIWSNGYWDSWFKSYKTFVSTIRLQIRISIGLQRTNFDADDRQRLTDYLDQRTKALLLPPSISEKDPLADIVYLPERKDD